MAVFVNTDTVYVLHRSFSLVCLLFFFLCTELVKVRQETD